MCLKRLREKGFLRKVRYSIRTRYSLATGFFLLVILGLFYVGGRIVLVHLVKDAEMQVRKIGADINRLANRNSGLLRRYVESIPDEHVERPVDKLLGPYKGVHVAFAARLGADGHFVEGAVAGEQGGEAIQRADIEGYESKFAQWTATAGEEGSLPAGLVSIQGVSYYVALRRCADGRFLLLGSRYDATAFTAQLNESFAGLELRVSRRSSSDTAVSLPVTRIQSKREVSALKQSFGLSSMVSEAFEFYTGGYWKLGDNPFEAVYTVCDIAGNPVSRLSVSLPQTFSTAAGSAIGRLTIFVTIVGIVLVVPVFWFQSRMLLNPLSKMTD